MFLDGFFYYFTDPVLRAPTIGSMLMCFSAALVGVISFLRRESLIGETISHASYPGVVFSALLLSFLGVADGDLVLGSFVVLLSAFLSGVLSLGAIRVLTQKLKVKPDAALCFVLSSFFGIGLTLASRLQATHTQVYRRVLLYLYGQAATMVDFHIYLYLVISLIVVGLIALFFKELKVISFDREYAKSVGIGSRLIDSLTLFLVVFAVVIGIRSVGVVLMSAMLIAPAASARQYTDQLSRMFLLAGFFGALSALLGNIFSVELSKVLTDSDLGYRLTLPTGPMIVIVSTGISLFSLLFAPKRGVVLRFFRIFKFRYRSLCENILKAIWRMDQEKAITLSDIQRVQSVNRFTLSLILFQLRGDGSIEWRGGSSFCLTDRGRVSAEKIVRFHRLWEVYLADYLGVGAEKVHCSAEEMEHIITPEIEKELTEMLDDPKFDPHQQPIPPKRRYDDI